MTTIWIDANVVLRLILNEPPGQATQARRFMRRAEEGEFALRLAPLILAEVVFVLEHVYRRSKHEIATALSDFIRADGIETDDADACGEALALAADGKLSFPDAYLAAMANGRGEAVCTFDEGLKRQVVTI